MNLSLLQVSISAVASSLQGDTPLKVDVTVRNNAEHPVTVLAWDSPLDPQAGLLGIFEAVNVNTKSTLQLPTARFARQLPPPPESFVEIGSHEDYKSTTVLPTIGLISTGAEYRLEAKGSWRAVWSGTKDAIDEKTLNAMVNANSGEFISNEVTVKKE